MIHTINNPKLVDNSYLIKIDSNKAMSNFTGVVIDKKGTIGYYLDGERHRTDGPAIIEKNGAVRYCQYGNYHRIDGPAVIDSYGSKSYYLNGNRHRKDGPARIGGCFKKEYWIDDKYLDISTDQELQDYLILRIFE